MFCLLVFMLALLLWSLCVNHLIFLGQTKDELADLTKKFHAYTHKTRMKFFFFVSITVAFLKLVDLLKWFFFLTLFPSLFLSMCVCVHLLHICCAISYHIIKKEEVAFLYMESINMETLKYAVYFTLFIIFVFHFSFMYHTFYSKDFI